MGKCLHSHERRLDSASVRSLLLGLSIAAAGLAGVLQASADEYEATIQVAPGEWCGLSWNPPIEGCGNTWRGQKTVYVLGGPLAVDLFRGGPCQHRMDHEEPGSPEDPRPPWYLTYFDYDPRGARPANSQQVNRAQIRAAWASEQPPGTRFMWTVLAPGVILTQGIVNGQPTNTSTIEIAAAGPSAPGAVKVYLTYRLEVEGYEWPFEWSDDTDEVPRANNKNRASPDYRSFTAHRPTRMDVLARGPWSPRDEEGPPRWIYWHWWPFHADDQFGLPMDGIWVQERFPNGVPTELPDGTPARFYWNGDPPPRRPPAFPLPSALLCGPRATTTH